MVTNLEWKNRRLCSDGNCIGVIGPDGRCKECGRPYEGEDLPLPTDDDPQDYADASGMADEWVPPEDAIADQGDEHEHAVAANGEDDAATDANDDWQNRQLCSDGNCIGVIGPDGRCKECGRPATDRPDDAHLDDFA